jgi:outer membrane protein
MRAKNLILSAVVLLNVFTANAQEAKSAEFSLQAAIDYAYKNSPNYLNAQNDVLMARYKRKEVLGMAMPQISTSVDMKNFLEIPASVVPGEFFGGPPGSFAAARFGTTFQTQAGASASLLVFSADYLVGLKATKEYISLMNINVTRSKTELASQVSKAYYSVLVNKARNTLLNANITQLEKLLSDTKAFNKQGMVEQIDVDRLEVAYNNLLTEKQKIERFILFSHNVLKFQMGYTGQDNLVLTDSLSVSDNSEISLSKIDIAKRSEYQLLESQQRLNTINVKRLQFGYLPTLVAYGNVAANGFGNTLEYVGYLNKYFQTRLLGATLSLNVFDGFQRHYKIQQAKLDFKKGENDLKNLQLAIELEGASAVMSYNNAISSLQIQKRNLELAQNVYNVSQKKYEQGVGSNLEVINAQTSLKESQTNYTNAVYDLLISKVEYLKATGSLVK